MLHFARPTKYFPLTLTLSLKEREQQASDWRLADGRWADSRTGVIERRWTILPLPRGEGRGEGEPSVSNTTVQAVIRKFRANTRRYYLLPSSEGNAQTIFGSPMMGTLSTLEVPPASRRSPATA